MTDKQEKKKKKEDEKAEALKEILKESENEELVEEKVIDPNETVTIPLAEYAKQLEELDALREKTDEFSDGWQRERADFSNFRKRVERDQVMSRANMRIDILRKYLDVHDDLERAVKNMPESVASDPWVNGLDLIMQKLARLLESEGVQEIPAEGELFNPDLHEAITSEENSDFKSEEIIEVVQKGYKLGERVIRPAKVRVAK